MLAKRNDTIEAARILLFISFTALAVTLTSCSQNEDNATQVLPGSLAALSVGGSLLEGAVVTQIGPYNDVPRAVSILADGKILVAGASYDERLVDLFIARFDRGGRLDSAFGNHGIVTSPVGSGNDRVQAIAIQPDGRILVAGGRHNGQDLDTSISRYLLDGSLDTTFAQGGIYKVSMGIGNDIANALSLQEDGSILVAGTGHDDIGAIGFTAIKLMPQGIPDVSFGNGGRLVLRLGVGEAQTEDSALLVSVDPQNRVVVADGWACSAAPARRRCVPAATSTDNILAHHRRGGDVRRLAHAIDAARQRECQHGENEDGDALRQKQRRHRHDRHGAGEVARLLLPLAG